jgi:hypothetical protein
MQALAAHVLPAKPHCLRKAACHTAAAAAAHPFQCGRQKLDTANGPHAAAGDLLHVALSGAVLCCEAAQPASQICVLLLQHAYCQVGCYCPGM